MPVVPPPILFWVVALWAAGAFVFGVRLLIAWAMAERLRSRLVHAAPSHWQQTIEQLKARVAVSRPVRLLVSPIVQAPVVVGWLRPYVLVPLAALANLPPEQVEAILLHELAHIRRQDYLINILQSVVEALLFYHPAVWWISGHMRTERELCCDDVAVSITGDAVGYARALAELATASPRLSLAAAATGGSLRDRIARLLGHPHPELRTPAAPGAVAAVILAVAALAVFAQPAAHPKFEAAVIKPSQTQNLQRVRPLPGRLTADASLRLLIQNAYGVQEFQIVDAPSWVSDRYSIEAKADGEANRDQVFLMLQSLLEDRFQLKTHRERRELPAYALVAAKSGLKVAGAKGGRVPDATARRATRMAGWPHGSSGTRPGGGAALRVDRHRTGADGCSDAGPQSVDARVGADAVHGSCPAGHRSNRLHRCL
jgi:beta-lactamase regulating signal transducer with metallopeptidase domain